MTTAITARHARPPARRQPSRVAWAEGLIRLIRAVLSRLAYAWGLARLAVFLVFHLSAPLPTGSLNVRVPDAPRGIRVDVLDEIACAYRTRTVKRFGCQVAERRFGPVVVEAHLKDENYTALLAARMGTAGTGEAA